MCVFFSFIAYEWLNVARSSHRHRTFALICYTQTHTLNALRYVHIHVNVHKHNFYRCAVSLSLTHSLALSCTGLLVRFTSLMYDFCSKNCVCACFVLTRAQIIMHPDGNEKKNNNTLEENTFVQMYIRNDAPYPFYALMLWCCDVVCVRVCFLCIIRSFSLARASVLLHILLAWTKECTIQLSLNSILLDELSLCTHYTQHHITHHTYKIYVHCEHKQIQTHAHTHVHNVRF